MTFRGLPDSELLKIRKELYLEACKYLMSEFGNFDIKKVKLSDNVISACRIVKQHKRECAKCVKTKCNRRASLVIEPVIDKGNLEITGFIVGGQPCKEAEQKKDKTPKGWG